jgi:hypothetical protein
MTKHRGMFQKGHDPRRFDQVKFANGESFRSACREKSEAALELLGSTMEDADQSLTLRVQCARYIIEQGHGKPVTALAIADANGKPIDSLGLDQLDLMIAQYLTNERDITPESIPIEHCASDQAG